MRRIIRHRPSPAMAVAVIALVVALGGVTVAAIPGPTGIVKGCYQKRTGALRIIDSARRCSRTERTLTWSQRGTPGPQGLQGAQGIQGPPGAAGSNAQFNGAAAGGDLTGTYPAPLAVPSIARDSEITPTVLANDGSGSTLDGDTIDGIDSPNLAQRRPSGGTNVLFYVSTYMDTGGTNDYQLSGEMKLRTTGTPGEFKLCDTTNLAAIFNYVVYVNGTRSTGTLTNTDCTSAFDPGATGDFQIYVRRLAVFGVHSGDGATNENYGVFALSQS